MTFIFIVFEIYQIVTFRKLQAIMITINSAKEYGLTKVKAQELCILELGYYRFMLACALFYTLFCVYLLFTQYWFIGAGILIIGYTTSQLYKKYPLRPPVISITDSIVCIAFLGYILNTSYLYI